MATTAHPVLAVFDQGGQPLFLGRGTRLATPAHRLALAARDRGCTRPGCPAPPAWCEVHHLITTTGYTVRLGTNGHIQWTAPTHLDPSRTPRTNPLHHPPDLTDTAPPPETGRSAAA